jgi:cell wall-associated NlpC family hydrolase
MPLSDRQRIAVVQEAVRWLGTPWHHNARVRGAGVDCGQLLIAVYNGAGLVGPLNTGAYPADWMLHRHEELYLSWVEAYMSEVPSPMPGDAAVWRIGKCFSHGAVVVDWPKVVHAYRPARQVCYGDGANGVFALKADGSPRPVKFYTLRMP